MDAGLRGARPQPGFRSLSTRQDRIDTAWRTHVLDLVARLAPDDPEAAVARAGVLIDSGLHLGGDTDAFAHPHERVYSLPEREVARSELVVVTQTEMAGPGTARWTQTTLKALASGLPVIVFGNQGTIGAHGFDLLRDMVDHAYASQAAPVGGAVPRPPAGILARADAAARNQAVFATAILRVSMPGAGDVTEAGGAAPPGLHPARGATAPRSAGTGRRW